MIRVDDVFPHDPNITDIERKSMRFPESLRGIKDRVVAQFAFDGWLASNPESARKYNPEHWSDR